MKTKISIRGEVHIKVYERGILIEEIVDNNLVVNGGKTNLAKLLGGDASGKKIEKISIGTNATTAVSTDTTITGAFTKPISSVTYPDSNSVQFAFEIEDTEANGMTIREFGLLNTDNVLCARKVRDNEIVKTSLIRLVGTWKISIN